MAASSAASSTAFHPIARRATSLSTTITKAASSNKNAPTFRSTAPLQYAAAAVAEVARTKAPDSPVVGKAPVFIFPDLDTGNTTYKAVQRAANVISIGPMLQGLRRPVNDLSRGTLVDDILYTNDITAIQAQENEQA